MNKWAFACEQMIHGKASGVDNFICTYGSMVNISFVKQPKGNLTADFKLLQNVAQLRVLLVNSGTLISFISVGNVLMMFYLKLMGVFL